MFSLSNFSSIFPGGSADPICPYVRTPMCSAFAATMTTRFVRATTPSVRNIKVVRAAARELNRTIPSESRSSYNFSSKRTRFALRSSIYTTCSRELHCQQSRWRCIHVSATEMQLGSFQFTCCEPAFRNTAVPWAPSLYADGTVRQRPCGRHNVVCR